jgi:hypothetical protein
MYVGKLGPAFVISQSLSIESIITFMPVHPIEGLFAVLAVFCVLMIFFFPSAQGPYCAVHGPVTALLSVRAAISLQFRIGRAGLSALKDRLHRVRVAFALFVAGTVVIPEFRLAPLPSGCTSILRC